MSDSAPRNPEHSVSEIFPNRWSPRSYTGEAIPDAILMRIFEAARWAPSASNAQPWRFIVAKRETPDFERFLDLLVDRNRAWACKAAALVALVSKRTKTMPGASEETPNRAHSLDAGAAWAHLALEASIVGWPAHGMLGLDIERLRSELGIPDDHHFEMLIAIGRRGDREALPETYRAAEMPNGRLPVSDIVRFGVFGSV